MDSIGIENYILLSTVLLFLFISCLIIFVAIVQKRTAKREKCQEKLLSEAIIKSQENERKTIGEELHEDISPVLVSVLINLNSLINKPIELFDTNVENAIADVELAINKLRAISHQLHPAAIENFGLLFGLSDFAKIINNSKKINIQIQSSIINLDLSSFQQLIIYRIIQELVINAIKHGSAKNINLVLTTDDSNLNIYLSDDGINFDAKAYKRGLTNVDYLGLKIVQQKLNLLKGSILFSSKPNVNMNNISLHIPLH